MAHLSLRGLSKTYSTQSVLDNVDLDIRSGEFVVFVGPSGCGKSTLLRMIAGLESITSGELSVDGQRLNEVHASKRGVAMVFQNYALYPHMTVRGNLSYGLKIAATPASEIVAKVGRAAEMLQLTPYLDRRPGQLSGGQRQRVAIGRALVRDPRLFLFDEPLSNLDAALRTATRVEIARLKAAMPNTTMIYVTHDQIEAMTLADRIVVMNQGRIEQVGSPLDLYHRPANRFVAAFIGSPAMNLLSPADLTQPPAGAAEVGVRPEDLRLVPLGQALLHGMVEHCERLGEVTIAHLRLYRGGVLVTKLPGDSEVRPGDDIALTADPARLHCFDASGKRLARPT
ncbi:MAG: sn-glycerol-3-phosphate ABC transporter ATP-binding protein UgpC [Alphaproteobacteria bacterium]